MSNPSKSLVYPDHQATRLLGMVDATSFVVQRRPKLSARRDAELREHLAKVPLNGARADEQLRADLGVREAVAREPRDLLLLRRQFVLSVPELAQIATVPAAGAVAGLDRAGAKTAAPSRLLLSTGKVLGRAGERP
jgi:hypothetical protein